MLVVESLERTLAPLSASVTAIASQASRDYFRGRGPDINRNDVPPVKSQTDGSSAGTSILSSPVPQAVLDDPKYRAYSPRRPDLTPQPNLLKESTSASAVRASQSPHVSSTASPERSSVISIAAATSILAWPADRPASPPIEESRVVLLVR
jgi:hypothetical protein